ncbi:UNVERIFIED_CONTAM: hypothetical protein FKN15_000375 [Acipenser sinensis]
MSAFEDKWGVTAAIDGCHITIKAPEIEKDSYFNRKGFPSILLQGVCDHEMTFIDASAGWPDSVHDARVFRNSQISTVMENQQILHPDGHVLGDSAYPLETHLLTPYRDNGHLTRKKSRYSYLHRCARSFIERCFAQLKGTFCRLTYLDMSRTDMIPKVTISACVLHNIII